MLGLELGGDVQGAALMLIVAVALFLFLITGARVLGLLPPPRPHYWKSDKRSPFQRNQGRDLNDVGQQLHAVMASSFQKRRVLSSSEYRVFKIIEDDMAKVGTGYRVFAQTSLGEILHSEDDAAFHSINSKRVDILVVDRGGWPLLAIEYQGSGHYQGTAAARDAIKKEALRKAGVRYIEINTTDDETQIRSRAREQLGLSTVVAANSRVSVDTGVFP